MTYICLQLLFEHSSFMGFPVFSTLLCSITMIREVIFSRKRERYCTVSKKLCSRPCFVRPVIAQNTARLRISLRNSRRVTVASESFSACWTPTAFRSEFSRRTVENLKVAYGIAITRRKLTIPSFQPGYVSVRRRLYTEANGPKGPLFVHSFYSPSFVFPRASNPKKRSYI